MDWASENWFFLLVLLICGGMHLFHGHGGDGHADRRDDTGPGR